MFNNFIKKKLLFIIIINIIIILLITGMYLLNYKDLKTEYFLELIGVVLVTGGTKVVCILLVSNLILYHLNISILYIILRFSEICDILYKKSL